MTMPNNWKMQTTTYYKEYLLFLCRLNRYKRASELTPDEIIALLTLWETERRQAAAQDPHQYRPIWSRYDPDIDLDLGLDSNELDQNPDENWLENPVYPHASRLSQLSDYPRATAVNAYEGYDDKKKRFMVAKKRSDPTRELR